MVDQTAATLMQLLKNISEECGEVSPGNTLAVHNSLRSGAASPNISVLSRQLQDLISPSGGLNVNLISPSPTPKQSRSHVKTDNSSACNSPNPEIRSSTHCSNEIPSTPPLIKSQESNKFRSKSPLPEEPLSPPPIGPKSPPPLIQITRTESTKLIKKDDRSLIEIISPPSDVETNEGNL